MMRQLLMKIFITFAILAFWSCSIMQTDAFFSPIDQNTEEKIQPGLIPRYFAKFFERNIGKLPDDANTKLKSWVGEPILQLDHQFGKGEVFGSWTSRGIGIRMRGVLYFPAQGSYSFQALSNDGVRMYLGDRVVVNDPMQHADQLSEESIVYIKEPGWYPLKIEYFQRKGTAALKLYWKTPEQNTMEIVPASAYGHIPAT